MARRMLLVAMLVAAVCGAIVSLTAAGSGQSARAEVAQAPLPHASEGRCPRIRMQALPGDAVGRAALAALAQSPVLYRGLDLKDMRVTMSALARDDDPGRGGYARVKCGRRAEDRSVVVSLEFPAMRPSASLSQGVVLVSRFAGRYRVWALLH